MATALPSLINSLALSLPLPLPYIILCICYAKYGNCIVYNTIIAQYYTILYHSCPILYNTILFFSLALPNKLSCPFLASSFTIHYLILCKVWQLSCLQYYTCPILYNTIPFLPPYYTILYFSFPLSSLIIVLPALLLTALRPAAHLAKKLKAKKSGIHKRWRAVICALKKFSFAKVSTLKLT